jgi:AGCS family alanine or glycine:cation symporter
MFDSFATLMEQFAGLVWGWPLLILLFGTHIYLTIHLGFIQRFIGRMIRLSVAPDKGGQGDVSHFGALTTALAATIGTGNIFGVAGAILIGGPGAVFWMWLTGVLGISTKYAEALLSVKYRTTTPDGRTVGGPMFVLEKALGLKWLGMIFAAFTALAAFGIGNTIQSNTLADLGEKMSADLPFLPTIPSWVTGLVLAAGVAAVILGGIQSIARVCQFFVPIMAALYVLGCAIILAMDLGSLPGTILLILDSAFNGHAAVGGFAGAGIAAAMRYGIARGLFSNESGLGSAPIVAAAARTTNPVRQAMVSATGTFWDTVIVCLMTGLVIVGSGDWQLENLDKRSLCLEAFSELGLFGKGVLFFGLLTFVFSTILGWSYYGERAMEYLFGPKSILPYRCAWVAAVFIGSISAGQIADTVWNFSDAMNGLMAIPNLVSLLLLSKVLLDETRAHRTEFTGRN